MNDVLFILQHEKARLTQAKKKKKKAYLRNGITTGPTTTLVRNIIMAYIIMTTDPGANTEVVFTLR